MKAGERAGAGTGAKTGARPGNIHHPSGRGLRLGNTRQEPPRISPVLGQPRRPEGEEARFIVFLAGSVPESRTFPLARTLSVLSSRGKPRFGPAFNGNGTIGPQHPAPDGGVPGRDVYSEAVFVARPRAVSAKTGPFRVFAGSESRFWTPARPMAFRPDGVRANHGLIRPTEVRPVDRVSGLVRA